VALGTVAILLPAGAVPRWMREVADATAAVAGAVAVATVEDPGPPPSPPTRAYLALDRRLFAETEHGPAPSSAPPAAAGGADVVVRLAPGATGLSGRLGELALLVCGAPVGRDAEAVLDRLAQGAATIDTDLCWRRPGAPALVVASARSAAAPPSVHRTRAAALAAAAGLV
jgi:hypothetical protein